MDTPSQEVTLRACEAGKEVALGSDGVFLYPLTGFTQTVHPGKPAFKKAHGPFPQFPGPWPHQQVLPHRSAPAARPGPLSPQVCPPL